MPSEITPLNAAINRSQGQTDEYLARLTGAAPQSYRDEADPADTRSDSGSSVTTTPGYVEAPERAGARRARMLLLGLSACFVILGATVTPLVALTGGDFKLLWPAAYYAFFGAATVLLLTAAFGIAGYVFRSDVLRASFLGGILCCFFCCCASFIMCAMVLSSDKRIAQQWDSAVKSAPSAICDLEHRRHCSGWSFLCSVGDYNASAVSPSTVVECPNNCTVVHGFNTTCETWFRETVEDFRPTMIAVTSIAAGCFAFAAILVRLSRKVFLPAPSRL